MAHNAEVTDPTASHSVREQLERPVLTSSHRWHHADPSPTLPLSHMLAYERICYHLSLAGAQRTVTGY